jgi:hypothetical protein
MTTAIGGGFLSLNKFIYIAKRSISKHCEFDFLGYLLHIYMDDSNLKFTFGITDAKRSKYISKIKQTLIEYKKNNNIELLRHRIKLFSARIVYSVIRDNDYCFWVTKGVVNNYNELRFHLDSLDPETEKFLRDAYYDTMKSSNMIPPYFMHRHNGEHSIYNLYSNMTRNRSIIFDEKIGIKLNDLIKTMQKVNPSYFAGKKEYYQITNDYLEFLGIKRHRGYAPMPGCNVQPDWNPALITCVGENLRDNNNTKPSELST